MNRFGLKPKKNSQISVGRICKCGVFRELLWTISLVCGIGRLIRHREPITIATCQLESLPLAITDWVVGIVT